jgi:glycosyltransferase involved in cell wall biosynthesis
MLYVFLAPRANSAIDGHFYWYLYRVVENFIKENKNAIVLVRDSSDIDSVLELAEGSTVKIARIEDVREWGFDIGKIRPFRLSKLIIEAIAKSGLNVSKVDKVIIFSNETSLSSVLSVFILTLRHTNISAMLNLLDVGFWKKLINDNKISQTLWKLVGKIFRQNSRLVFSTNSSDLLKILHSQGFTSARLWKYYQLTNPIPKIKSIDSAKVAKNRGNSESRILVMPWPNYAELVVSAVEYLLNDTEFKGRIQIHLKSSDSAVPYQALKAKSQNDEERLIITQGALDEEKYFSILSESSLVWFPYNSYYHAESGSGRAVDALSSGTPIMIDEKSNLFYALDSRNLEFIYPVDCSNSSLVATKCIEILENLLEMSRNSNKFALMREEISKMAQFNFSAESMLNEVTESLSVVTNVQPHTVKKMVICVLLELYFYIIYLLFVIREKTLNTLCRIRLSNAKNSFMVNNKSFEN